MLPTSSRRPVLINKTNVNVDTSCTPSHPKGKRPSDETLAGEGSKKRARISLDNVAGNDYPDESDSDVDIEDVTTAKTRARKRVVFSMLRASSIGSRPGFMRPSLSTRPILQSFVSSNKADIYKCQSTATDTFLTPPYACAYSNAAKGGATPLLAVATEEGSVHIINTSKRRDWDYEPTRVIFQPHTNAVFDVKWNSSDSLLATASGDRLTRISCIETGKSLHTLQGHQSTVKCVTWDPSNPHLLSTGGRDGAIRIWDIRAVKKSPTSSSEVLDPVITISGAHEDGTLPKQGRRRKTTPLAPSVTGLVYPDGSSEGLISCGSYDGILHHWDLRFPSASRKGRPYKPKATELYSSSVDPTALHGSRRPRGIISITKGTGATAGLLFALGADSRVHTYCLPTLEPFTTQTSTCTHDNMQTNSFYVRVATSPCGRWLASGSMGASGTAFLYDVSNAGRMSPSVPWEGGVELTGQKGEVGALDWADGSLATCADDGTVRVWRPDVEVHRECEREPEEKKWEWGWAVGE